MHEAVEEVADCSTPGVQSIVIKDSSSQQLLHFITSWFSTTMDMFFTPLLLVFAVFLVNIFFLLQFSSFANVSLPALETPEVPHCGTVNGSAFYLFHLLFGNRPHLPHRMLNTCRVAWLQAVWKGYLWGTSQRLPLYRIITWHLWGLLVLTRRSNRMGTCWSAPIVFSRQMIVLISSQKRRRGLIWWNYFASVLSFILDLLE